MFFIGCYVIKVMCSYLGDWVGTQASSISDLNGSGGILGEAHRGWNKSSSGLDTTTLMCVLDLL